jgi:hypothetical protein
VPRSSFRDVDAGVWPNGILDFIDEYGIDVTAIDDDSLLRILERLTLCSFTDTSEKMLAFKHLMR